MLHEIAKAGAGKTLTRACRISRAGLNKPGLCGRSTLVRPWRLSAQCSLEESGRLEERSSADRPMSECLEGLTRVASIPLSCSLEARTMGA